MSLPIYSALVNSPSWYASSVLDTLEWNYEEKCGIFYFASRKQIYFIKVFEVANTTKLIEDKQLNSFYDTKVQYYIEAHHDTIVGLCTIPNSVLILFKDVKLLPNFASCGRDKMIRVWSFNENTGCCCLREFNIGSTKIMFDPTCISISSSNIILCGFEKGSLLLWNYLVESEHKVFHTFNEDIIQIVCNDQHFAIGYKKGMVIVFQMNSFDSISKVTQFRAHNSDVCNISWNPLVNNVDQWGDLATAGKDRKIRLWKINTNFNVKTLILPGTLKKAGNDAANFEKDNSNSTSNWSSLCWSPINNGTLIVSNSFGNIGVWRTTGSSDLKYFTQNSQTRAHSKSVFSVREFSNYPGLLVSHSLDRSVNISRVLSGTGRSGEVVHSIPCMGGSVLSMHAVTHSHQLAIGCSDNMVRLWRCDGASVKRPELNTLGVGSSNTPEMTNIWNGIGGKVLSLCWHPTRDGVLAFGTDTGEVGSINVGKDKKTAVISKLVHRGKVFVVKWAVDFDSTIDQGSRDNQYQPMNVYSVGNFSLYSHNFRDDRFVDLSNLVTIDNDSSVKITDFVMHDSQRFFAVGYGNGSVNVFSMKSTRNAISSNGDTSNPLILVCQIKTHTKGINCMKWYPIVREESSIPYRLAIGSNERFVTVTDLGTVISDFELLAESISHGDKWNVVVFAESFAKLKGHGDRVTAVDWCPFDVDKLVSASYDRTAFVWSVSKGAPIVTFNCHQGRVLSCHWSRRDMDLVYTGGEDSNLFAWRPSQQTLKTALNRRRYIASAVPGLMGSSDGGHENNQSIEIKAVESIKSAEVMEEETNEIREETETEQKGKEREKKETPKKKEFNKQSNRSIFQKKRSSLFPTTIFKTHSPLDAYQTGVLDFIDRRSNYLPYLSIFDTRMAIIQQIDKELVHHKAEQNLENYFLILIWTGRIGRVVSETMSMGYSPDWLVAIIFAFSARDIPEQMVSMVVNNIVTSQKDPILAATYLVAIGNSRGAVELLRKEGCLREAIVLAKLRLPINDPIIGELLILLRAKSFRNGNFEIAAMCSLMLEDYSGIVEFLGRRASKLADWVAIMVLIKHQQFQLVQRCLLDFISNILLECPMNVPLSEFNDWINKVKLTQEISHYSIIIDFHRFIWIDGKSLHEIWLLMEISWKKYGKEKLMALLSHIQSKSITKQINQAENQLSLYLTYELLLAIMNCGCNKIDLLEFDQLNQLIDQYNTITLKGNQLIDQLIDSVCNTINEIQPLVIDLLNLKFKYTAAITNNNINNYNDKTNGDSNGVLSE